MTHFDETATFLEEAVARVLAGADLYSTAASAGLDDALLKRAVVSYRAAGRSALLGLRDAAGWTQFDIDCESPVEIEQILIDIIGPALETAYQDGSIKSWWFMRKPPGLRVRFRSPREAGPITKVLDIFSDIQASGVVKDCVMQVYEPELEAFGGHLAMEASHQLFHSDSRSFCRYLSDAAGIGLGLTETSILLCSILFRCSGLDWYEAGDVWTRVTQHRPGGTPISDEAESALRRLMTVDAGSGSKLVADGPLSGMTDWISSYETAGAALAKVNSEGGLTRGLRQVLCHHVLFHWNRIGLPARTQGQLAESASRICLG